MTDTERKAIEIGGYPELLSYVARLETRVARLESENKRQTWELQAIRAQHARDLDELNELRKYVAALEASNERYEAAELDDSTTFLGQAPGYDNENLPAFCATCGSELEHVRPGKWQCNVCEAQDGR